MLSSKHEISRIIITLAITYLYGCSDRNESIIKDEKIVVDSTSLPQNDNVVLKRVFPNEFFTKLKSVGFEIDSVKSFNENEIKSYKVSQLFTYYHRVNYNDSIFEFKINTLKWYFISGIDSLMSKEQKKAEFYKGRLALKEISFSDSSSINTIKNKYNTVLNLDINPGVGKITRTYYDMKNNKIWFLYDRSLKSSKQFNTVSNIVDVVEADLK